MEGHHINEVHISISTVPPTSYVLQLGTCTLAGGTTDDYASHIQTCFNVIVSSYAEYHKPDPIQTKSTIIHHLKNTLTDRVAVNHCVVQSLRSSLDIELLELKCNVHPLDGIAKRCTDLLKVYDKEYNITSDTFGNGCCAVNFMYAMTKMRFKQGKGDPGGFKQYLRQENIKPGIIVRYLGNLFHIGFHLFKRKTLIYLDTSCRNTICLRSALQKDLINY